MKRFTLITLLSFFAFGSLFSQSAEVKQALKAIEHTNKEFKALQNVDRPGTHEHYLWADTDWALQTTTTFTYNANGEITLEVIEDMGGTLLEISYEYDGNGFTSQSITRQKDPGGEWFYVQKVLYTTDVSGFTLTEEYQEWYDGVWVTMEGSKNELTKDGDKILENISSEWDLASQSWSPVAKTIYSYSGDIIDYTIFQAWDEEAQEFINMNKTFYTYTNDDPPQIEQFLNQRWTGTEWENSYKSDFTYTANSEIWLSYTWIEGDWSKSGRQTYEYDSHGNDTMDKFEMWIAESWMMISSSVYDNSYSNDHLVQVISQEFLITTQAYENSSKDVYSDFSGSKVNLNTISSLSLYPNPASEEIQIAFNTSLNSDYQIQILNVNGQEVKSVNLKNTSGLLKKGINISNFVSGVYFINIKQDNQIIYNSKFIKE